MDKNLVMLSLLLLLAVACDLRERRIPNALIGVGLALGLVFGALAGGLNEVGSRSLGAFAGLAALFPFFALRMLGAGDVKLMAVVGSFTGASALLPILLYTFIAGGALALIAFAVTRSASTAFANLRMMLAAVALRVPGGIREMGFQTAVRLPYAIAIALGVGFWAGIGA